MASSVSKSSRSVPAPKGKVPRYLALAEAIRSRIAAGEFPAGSQLPSQQELAEQNGVALLTARQAVGILAKKGIVRRLHGHGTFVEAVAQKDLVAVVCGPNLREELAYFYRTIVKTLETEGERRNFAFRIYDGLTDERGRLKKDSQGRKSFRSDLANYNFAGAIEIAPGREAIARPAPKLPFPKVTFEGGLQQSDVDFDFRDFGKTSVRHLASVGCRTILIVKFAMMESGVGSPVVLEGAFDGVAESGISDLKIRVVYLTINPVNFSTVIYEAVRELIQGWETGESDRPDGLIVSDDIFMRDVALALIQSGYGSEKKLPIVCLSCEGYTLHYGLPVTRYEYQVRKFAVNMLDILELKRREAALPKRPIFVKGVLKKDAL